MHGWLLGGGKTLLNITAQLNCLFLVMQTFFRDNFHSLDSEHSACISVLNHVVKQRARRRKRQISRGEGSFTEREKGEKVKTKFNRIQRVTF